MNNLLLKLLFDGHQLRFTKENDFLVAEAIIQKEENVTETRGYKIERSFLENYHLEFESWSAFQRQYDFFPGYTVGPVGSRLNPYLKELVFLGIEVNIHPYGDLCQVLTNYGKLPFTPDPFPIMYLSNHLGAAKWNNLLGIWKAIIATLP